MLLRACFAKILGPGALVALVAMVASGCGGCDDETALCDENGNCEICDAYGCHPANPTPSSGNSSTSSGSTSGGDVCDPNVTTCPCGTTSECSAGTQCIDGLCLDGCDFSYECGAGNVCANGKCVPGCDGMVPCAAPGYFCEKGACVPDPQNPQCDTNTPCPNGGEICVGGLCTTHCQTNAECPAGQICDHSSGACIADPTPQPTCNAQVMCPGTAQCMVDGYCHYPCTSLQTCKLIDNRFEGCDQGFCKTAEELNPECTISKPCPVGQDCISNKCL